jgi:hypothetical protein
MNEVNLSRSRRLGNGLRGGFSRTEGAAIVGTAAAENGLTGGPVGIGGYERARRNLGFCYPADIS